MKTLPLEKQIELAEKMKKNFSNSKNENLKKIIDKILNEKLQDLINNFQKKEPGSKNTTVRKRAE